ncbi:hypothetical protein [Nocardia sp. NPDC049707]|uniref:hypothetical protein n=1 Tax=Nocardia sp. NPDC049707 TaxID=3154735 RepID=UPI003434F993
MSVPPASEWRQITTRTLLRLNYSGIGPVACGRQPSGGVSWAALSACCIWSVSATTRSSCGALPRQAREARDDVETVYHRANDDGPA